MDKSDFDGIIDISSDEELFPATTSRQKDGIAVPLTVKSSLNRRYDHNLFRLQQKENVNVMLISSDDDDENTIVPPTKKRHSQEKLKIGNSARTSSLFQQASGEAPIAIANQLYKIQNTGECSFKIVKARTNIDANLKANTDTSFESNVHPILSATTTNATTIDFAGSSAMQRIQKELHCTFIGFDKIYEKSGNRPSNKSTRSYNDFDDTFPVNYIPNIDESMTESNTKLCIICGAKPKNLTYHYQHIHNTESYVSRLIDDDIHLLNLNIAQLVKHDVASSARKYGITCAFCKDFIVEPFVDFYQHYSFHTGEYAFQCSYCKLKKPFRVDIETHRLNARKKECAQAKIETLHPLSAKAIYLNRCTICGFVQMHQENIWKHLSYQHNTDLHPDFMQTYVLAKI